MIQTRLLGEEVVLEDWDVIQRRMGYLGTAEEGGMIEAIFIHPTLGLRFLVQLPSSGRLIEVSSAEIRKKSSQMPLAK